MAVGKRMTKSPSRSPRAAVAAGLAFAAVMAAGFPLLADVPAPPAAESAVPPAASEAEPVPPTAAEPAVPAAATEAQQPAAVPAQRQTTEAPGETGRDDASGVENDLRRDFNDLRRELLDHRMKLVDWWLIVMAFILTLFGIGGGYLGFKRFPEIEAEARGNVDTARKHTEEARKLVDEIKERRDEAVSLVKGITAEAAATEPDKADKAARSTQADPAASPIDRAISAAILFQQQGNNKEAIEKWRAVANVVDGIDDELGARAWFSIGYLHGEASRPQKAIDAYNKAIRLKTKHSRSLLQPGQREVPPRPLRRRH